MKTLLVTALDRISIVMTLQPKRKHNDAVTTARAMAMCSGLTETTMGLPASRCLRAAGVGEYLFWSLCFAQFECHKPYCRLLLEELWYAFP